MCMYATITKTKEPWSERDQGRVKGRWKRTPYFNNNDICCQAWRTEFHTQNPHGTRELVKKKFLSSVHACHLLHVQERGTNLTRSPEVQWKTKPLATIVWQLYFSINIHSNLTYQEYQKIPLMKSTATFFSRKKNVLWAWLELLSTSYMAACKMVIFASVPEHLKHKARLLKGWGRYLICSTWLPICL